jgi:hypothetical protein
MEIISAAASDGRNAAEDKEQWNSKIMEWKVKKFWFEFKPIIPVSQHSDSAALSTK